MRVIAGRFKSRSLRSLAGDTTRPTSDKLRETLFNVLTAGNPNALAGTVWLDLFAGTGAVGIEALSRGAQHVTFVERSPSGARVIQDNLRSLDVREGATVVTKEVNRAVRDLDEKGFRADYVFVDPPYKERQAYHDTLNFMAHSSIVATSAVIIAEHDKREDPGEVFEDLRRYRVLEQGDSKLSFYRKR